MQFHALLEEWPGEAIRLALLGGHYREPLEFSHERVAQAKQTLDRFYLGLREIAHAGAAANGAGDSGAVLDASGRLGASFSASPKKTMLCRPVMLRPQVHVEH